MQRGKTTELMIKIIAVAFGILGIVLICMAIGFAFMAVRDIELLIMVPLFLLIGSIPVAIAWQNLRHFSVRSINNFTGLVVYAIYAAVIPRIEPYETTIRKHAGHAGEMASFLFAVLLAVWMYRVVSRKLIQLTTADTQHSSPSRMEA